jgi:hypothetical protein
MTDTIKVHISDKCQYQNTNIFSQTFSNVESAIKYGKNIEKESKKCYENVIGVPIQNFLYDLTSLYIIFDDKKTMQISSSKQSIIARMIRTNLSVQSLSNIEIISSSEKTIFWQPLTVVVPYIGKKFKSIHIDGKFAWVYCYNVTTLLFCSLKSIDELYKPMIFIDNEI